MAVRKRKQTNAMLYTLVAFIGLFIIASAAAVMSYIKAEEYRTTLADTRNDFFRTIATQTEIDSMPTSVGEKQGSRSRFDTMMTYLDTLSSTILGGVAATTSAEVKVNSSNSATKTALDMAGKYITLNDPNTMGLVPVIKALVAELQDTDKAHSTTKQLLKDKESELTTIVQADLDRDKQLIAEKTQLQQQYDQIKQDYTKLEATLRQSTDQQVQNLLSQTDQLRTDKQNLNDKLLKTEAELELAKSSMQVAKEELAKISPGPDPNATAYKPDGKIILIDNSDKVVHLDLGVNNHVYRGLRFTVYDRGTSVQPDGKGKAEIEIYDIAQNYSSARVISSSLNRPILLGDIVGNLIWDSTKTNVFVIAGTFDLNNDGRIDQDAVQRITERIEEWGGRVDKDISINTDFVILGDIPTVLDKPSLEEQESDQTALTKYENSLTKLNQYNDIKDQAKALWIPVFTYERFLYFVGYQSPISQKSAL
jgi:hypothetical protein